MNLLLLGFFLIILPVNAENFKKKLNLSKNISAEIIFEDEVNFLYDTFLAYFPTLIFPINEDIIYTKDIFSIFKKKKINNHSNSLKSKKVNTHSKPKKPWTIIMYIAGDNDLEKYAERNIKQLEQIGSNENINILVHFDYHLKGKSKETKRFYVEKNNLLQIGDLPAKDSGDPQNLIEAADWALRNYPSDYFGIVLWNHGTGSCDPQFIKKNVNPSDFFYLNEENKKISLNRNIEFLSYIQENDSDKGICFDDTTRNYLDNKKLAYAFEEIYKLRKNEKIDIILMDACLMSAIEIAYLCSKYAKFLTASEEVVLGPGYNYASTLKLLNKEKVNPYYFALHVVKTYNLTYAPIANDFTQSAINLNAIEDFTKLFTEFVEILMKYKQYDTKDYIKKTLRLAGSREMVTHFSEPSYIDLKHFLENILLFIAQIPKNNFSENKETHFIKEIKAIINKLLQAYNKLIIANSHGISIPKASGLHIYFPRYGVDHGYKNTEFSIKTKWLTFLQSLK